MLVSVTIVVVLIVKRIVVLVIFVVRMVAIYNMGRNIMVQQARNELDANDSPQKTPNSGVSRTIRRKTAFTKIPLR